jgi:hypothetical protein
MAQGTWQFLPQAQASAKAGCGRGPIGVRRCRKASEVDGLFVACGGRILRVSNPGSRGVPDGLSRRGGHCGSRRGGHCGRWPARRDIAGTCRRGSPVTGGPQPGGSGHGGRRCSCRVPPLVGSTWAAVRKAGPLHRATRASPGTREHTATSPGPCRQCPPAWLWFRSPSLSLEDLGIGVSSATSAAESRFKDILPGRPDGG